jgi:leader peptidase (prepilin peptidase)/N-methyltransferase
MNVMWAAVGAVLGLLAGAALRSTVFRLSVPPGDPERTACPHCDGPVRQRLALRCGRCGRSLGTPLVLELGTAAVLALLLGRFAGQPTRWRLASSVCSASRWPASILLPSGSPTR